MFCSQCVDSDCSGFLAAGTAAVFFPVVEMVNLPPPPFSALQHMVEKLKQLQGKVVCVVGLAHLDGMEKQWELGGRHELM
jgi:hypothetical protein